MAGRPPPHQLDLDDFDAVGIASEVLVTLRVHAIEHHTDAAATVSSPEGWHRLVATARDSGHLVLSARLVDLSTSRFHNVSAALRSRGWDFDEDGDGATVRYPPGTETTTAAFELLAVLTLSGAPRGVREVTAVDGDGAPVDLDPLT
jgi:hypothetical protein